MKKILSLLILVILTQSQLPGQSQLGQTIEGSWLGSEKNMDISADGIYLIAENREQDVFVYAWNGHQWLKRGNKIRSNYSYSWGNLSISGDGSVVAIQEESYIKVYEWNDTEWSERGGPIDDIGEGRELISMDLTYDGNTISMYTDDNFTGELYIKTFKWNGLQWTQEGGRKKLEFNVQSTHPEGNLEHSRNGEVIIVGCEYCGIDDRSGMAFIYKRNGTTWEPMGEPITTQEFDNEFNIGKSVSISNDGRNILIASSRLIKAFEWDGSNWLDKGQDLKIIYNSHARVGMDGSGNKISMTESNFIDSTGQFSQIGRVSVLQFNGNNWIPQGNPIIGEETGNFFGFGMVFSKNGNVLVGSGLNIDGFLDIKAYSFDGWKYLPTSTFSSSLSECEPSRVLDFGEYIINAGNESYINIIGNQIPITIPLFDSVTIQSNIKADHFVTQPQKSVFYKDDLESLPINSIITDTFCLVPKDTTSNDIKIDIIIPQAARPGRTLNLNLIYSNIGTTVRSGTIELFFDGNIQKLVSSIPQYSLSSSHILTWDYKDLHPFEKRSIMVEFILNQPTEIPPLNGGERIFYATRIEPSRDDVDVTNNFVEADITVVNSFDPNDKRCMQGDTILPESVGKRLTYVIRFENVGTAEAIDISIRDFIDTSRLDIGSFELVDASHPPLIKISEGNLIEFIFKDINLPFNDEDNDGYVAFSMLSKKGLTIGDSITNQAAIYFDFNLPIITNEAVTEIQEQTTSTKNHVPPLMIHAFPNPANDRVQITADEPIQAISLLTLDGRIVRQEFYLNASETSLEILLTELPKGIYMIRVEGTKSQGVVKLVKE